MITFQPATAEQYQTFLNLTRDDAGQYLDATLKLMGLFWEEYADLFRTVGEVSAIYSNNEMAGFYWIELRERTLHLHGLILYASFRSHGIGTQVLSCLKQEFAGRADVIELGVHASNPRARMLYECQGFRRVRYLEDVDYFIMQCPLKVTKQ